MARIVTEADVVTYLREPSATVENVELYTRLANGVVSDVIEGLTPLPTRVLAITLEMAARAFRNKGFSSESIEDYRYQLPPETRQAGIYLTDSELVELELLSGQYPSSGVYSMPLGG